MTLVGRERRLAVIGPWCPSSKAWAVLAPSRLPLAWHDQRIVLGFGLARSELKLPISSSRSHHLILTVVTERVPSVAETDRVETEEIGRGIWRIVVRFGFAERPSLPPVLAAHAAEFSFDLAETSFFVGRELPVPSLQPRIAIWREKVYAFMTRNAVSAWQYFQIPPKRGTRDAGRALNQITGPETPPRRGSGQMAAARAPRASS
jgi:hypothetical protein